MNMEIMTQSLSQMSDTPHRYHIDGLPDAHAAMYLMGHHPAKLVMLLALDTFPEDEFVTGYRLKKRIESMRGENDTWLPGISALQKYCRDAAQPSGLTEWGKTRAGNVGAKNDKLADAARFTQRGRQICPIVAGAHLGLELRSLEQERFKSGYPLSLQIAMGRSLLSKKGYISGVPTRLDIYEALLQYPEGLSQAELKTATGASYISTFRQVQDLCHLDILVKEDSHGEKRIFELSDRISELTLNQVRTPETAAIITAIRHFHEKGAKQVHLKELLDCIVHVQPELSRRRANRSFSRWVTRPTSRVFTQEIKQSSEHNHLTRVRVREHYMDYLAELVRIRRLLTEKSEEGKDFREESGKRAKAIASSPEQIAQLLECSREHSSSVGARGENDWLHSVPSLIPLNGKIDTITLHNKVVQSCGRDIVYRAFRDRLNQLPEITVIEHAEKGRVGSFSFVSLRKWVFPGDWAHKAACLDKDPELFLPLAGSGAVSKKVQEQVARAKAICYTCPVKLACLKEALDIGEDNAVRGGIWFKQRFTLAFRLQEMPPEKVRRIYETIKILK